MAFSISITSQNPYGPAYTILHDAPLSKNRPVFYFYHIVNSIKIRNKKLRANIKMLNMGLDWNPIFFCCCLLYFE